MRLDPHLDCHTCGRSLAGRGPGATPANDWKRCARCGRLWACETCGIPVPAKDWQRDLCDCCQVCGALEDIHDSGRCAGCCTHRECA